VQKPFYPEGKDHPHLYLLHPPGGLVSGDSLSIDIALAESSSALFTAPGAARIYKAREDRTLQKQIVTIHLSKNASAEWLPQESIFYPGGFSDVSTVINFPEGDGSNSHFIGWEIACYGLSKKTSPFNAGGIKQSFEIWQGKKPLFIDKFNFDGTDQNFKNTPAGLQGNTVTGVMVSGPFSNDFLDSAQKADLLNSVHSISSDAGVLFANTLKGHWLITRYLGNNAEQARQLMTEVWQVVRPLLLNKKSVLPRIWSC
jgi:urease accessory protein